MNKLNSLPELIGKAARRGTLLLLCQGPGSLITERHDRHEHKYLLILHIAGVWHLLGINAKWFALGRVHSYDAMVYHVLQVGKTSPDVEKVVVRVVTGPREPNPKEKKTYSLNKVQRTRSQF